jgi:hypothetical protein
VPRGVRRTRRGARFRRAFPPLVGERRDPLNGGVLEGIAVAGSGAAAARHSVGERPWKSRKSLAKWLGSLQPTWTITSLIDRQVRSISSRARIMRSACT